MKPIYIHSGMTGAPQYANANGSINAILEACLVNGFNIKTATSAVASGGILTLNFAADPGFEALQTVEVALSSTAAVNGLHRVIANTNNQVTIAIDGLADGAVGSSGAGITIKQAGSGWSKPYSNSTTAVFRPPAGNRRYVRCVHAVNADFSARGYESMTAISTGTGPFPTTAQDSVSWGVRNYAYGAVDGVPWFLVATDRWMLLSMANDVTPLYSLGDFFFGDIAEQVKAGDAYATLIKTITGSYLCRNHAGATGCIAAELAANATYSATWPSVIADGSRLVPYVCVYQSDYVLRGFMPNGYNLHPHAPAANFLDVYSNLVGIAGRVKPVNLSVVIGNPMMSAIAIDEDAWS